MKTITYFLLTSMCISSAVKAQEIAANKVPAAVIAAFKAKFPTVTKTEWEMENKTTYEAEFKMEGHEHSACFDEAGNWLETETEIKVAALPIAIQTALSKDFIGFKINEASKIEHAKNGNCYEAEIEKDKTTFDVLFTPEGKVLSKTIVAEEKGEKD